MSVQTIRPPQPSIYCNPESGSKAPQKIGAVWHQIRELFCNTNSVKKKQQIVPFLVALGAAKTDANAHASILRLALKALQPGVQIIPSEDDTGVYRLSENGNVFGFFKVGEKRAGMELFMRRIAHHLGIEKHAIPGVYCSIANPIFPKEETIVELWNGRQKKFGGEKCSYTNSVRKDNFGLEQPYTLTGILEPYIASEEQMTIANFANMTVLALVTGLRDAKLNGILGTMFVDTEDCAPSRFLPERSPNRHVAATHLPYLAHPFAKEPILSEVLKQLMSKIDGSLVSFLKAQEVQIADLASEALKDKETGWDDGGCFVRIEASPQILEKQTSINMDPSEATPLFTKDQLDAFAMRLQRLKEFLRDSISTQKTPSSLDMVCAVDPLYGAQMKALEEAKFDRQPSTSIVGRYPLGALGFSLAPGQSQKVLSARLFGFDDIRGPGGSVPSLLDS